MPKRKEAHYEKISVKKGMVILLISSLDTDVKQVFFVCPEWRKTIKVVEKGNPKSN